MALLVITLILVLVGVVAYFTGALKLAKYGFRVSTGTGLAVLLFPPYTYYFSFKKLEVDGKGLPVALCSFGLVVTVLMCVIFWQPISLALTFQFDEATALISPEAEERDSEEPTRTRAAAEPEPAEEVEEEVEPAAEEELVEADEAEAEEEGEEDGGEEEPESEEEE